VSQPEQLPDGAVRLTGSDGCTFTFRRLRPGVMVVTIAGYDTGVLGDAPLDIMTAEAQRTGRLELFIDAREGTGVVTPVREAWTQWFQRHHAQLKTVTILVGDKLVNSAVGVAKHFSRTGDLIRVMSDAARFDALLRG
jgi:hypothetical protein